MMSIYKVKGKGKEGNSEGETSFIEIGWDLVQTVWDTCSRWSCHISTCYKKWEMETDDGCEYGGQIEYYQLKLWLCFFLKIKSIGVNSDFLHCEIKRRKRI